MHLIFLTHPSFFGSQSVPRFARMLIEGMKKRGHNVDVWSPQPRFFRLPLPKGIKKWLSYLDQYIVFPMEVRTQLKHCLPNTLFVFTDHALGPWVSLVADRAHVIHCHDFLAQRSAQGGISENKTGWSGRHYQDYIRRGYSKGKYFISVSQKTQQELHQFLLSPPQFSTVVYNGLNDLFTTVDIVESRHLLSNKLNIDLSDGYLLHVGGNQWYKNRRGVVELYTEWRSTGSERLPLLLIGDEPPPDLLNTLFKTDIHWLCNVDDTIVHLAYAGATVFLFPSLAEGFGWPIAEAMAAGCPVITTDEAPMTEVAGEAAYLIPRRPHDTSMVCEWAVNAASVIDIVVNLSTNERSNAVAAGLKNIQRFNRELALNRIESIYKEILAVNQES